MKPIYYQSANLTDDESINQFVVRLKEFNKVISEIRADDMTGSIQHYIFVGQRGSGKSTLLRRIEAAINTEKDLHKRLIAINLSEEQAGIYRLHDLWDRVIQELEVRQLQVEPVDWKKYGTDYTEYAKALYLAIQKTLKKEDRKLVLLLDNIDRIFKNIGEEAKLLREILSNHKDLRIIGGSTMLGEHHWDYHKPFFEFFRIEKLESLSHDEIVELLNHWSECLKQPKLKEFAEKHPGRLDALRILTDGMPRTMYNFVELLLSKGEHNSYDYLRHIVDRATPVYQERLEVLSAQHRKVVLELSFFWDAVKVAELSEATKIPSKLLSAVLSKLEDLKIVEKRKGTGKDKLYLLRERFFNFWLIMTQGGPQQKSEAKALTIFLETWYDSVEFKKLYKQFQKEIDSGKMTPDQAIINAKAFVHSKYLTWKERDSLIESTTKAVGNNVDLTSLLPKKAKDLYKEIIFLLEEEKYDEGIRKCLRIEQDDNVRKSTLGLLYYFKQDFAKAEENFIATIKGDEQPYGIAFQFLIRILVRQDRWDEADKIRVESENRNIEIDTLIVAKIHRHLNRVSEAKKELEKVTVLTAGFYVEQAHILELEGDFEGALTSYDEAAKLGEPDLEIFIVICLYALNKEPERAFELMKSFHKNNGEFLKRMTADGNLFFDSMLVTIGVWAGKFEVLVDLSKLIEKRIKSNSIDEMKNLVEGLLIHKQTNVVWELFFNEEFGSDLKSMIKPTYFATARLVNAEPSIAAQPPELDETVNSILAEIKEQTEFYYGKS